MRGTVLDFAFAIAMLFIFGVMILFGGVILDKIQDATNGTTIDDDVANQTLLNQGDDALKAFDFGFIFVAVGMGIAVILAAFLIDTHPAFYIVSFIALIVIIIVAAQFANFFDDIATNPEFVDEANQYPIMIWTMQNLPLILTIFGFVSMIVIFVRGRGAGGV